MGIQGLLHFLEKATRPFHLSEFKGATVAVDAYCWLDKGSFEAINIDQVINYCMQYLQLLQCNEIRPILIFNGQNLPLIEARKEEINNQESTLGAVGFAQSDRKFSYKKNINVCPELASSLIKKCHEFKIDCIVAPYEAAAQLAFFNLRGIAELIITEDTDLILYGCSKICLKLDCRGGGLLLDSDLICDVIKMKPDCHTFDKFKHMCILSGCDYIESLEGMTLNKAHQFITLTHDTNPETFLDTVPKLLNMPNLQISEVYKMKFMMVDAIYRHQIIFDPFTKKLEPLFDPHIAGTNPEYCKNAGKIFDQDKAYQVALGNLHPTTFEQLDKWDPKDADITNKSIWGSGPYERSPSRNQQKDSFKEYFSNYKFETIQETDFDDSTIKTEEENKTNIRREMEFNSQFSSTRPLNPFMETDYYDRGNFPTSRNYQHVQAFESIDQYPVHHLLGVQIPSMRRPIPETKIPVCKISGEIPQTKMPDAMPPTKMPDAMPQTKKTGAMPPTKMPGTMPPTKMPDAMPPTKMPGAMPPTKMPGAMPQTKMPDAMPQTKRPGFTPQTIMSGFVPITKMPGSVPQTGLGVLTAMPRQVNEKISVTEMSDVGDEKMEEDDEVDYVKQFSALDIVGANQKASDQKEEDSAKKECDPVVRKT